MTLETFILLFFTSISLTSMTYGFHLLTKSKDFLRTAMRTKATTIECILRKGRNGVCYQVTYEFEDREGNKIKSDYSSSKKVAKGSEISILYSKEDSNEHKVNNFANLYLTAIIFIFNGPLIIIAAVSTINS